MDRNAIAYLITFRCYATWLHGDERGSVHHRHTGQGEPTVPPCENLESGEARQSKGGPVRLDARCRAVVTEAIEGVCAHREWTLHALNVRSNHVHVVVSTPGSKPEPPMTSFKAWATRRLRDAGLVAPDRPMWARHGSTIYLWTPEDVAAASRYVVEEQEGARFVRPGDGSMEGSGNDVGERGKDTGATSQEVNSDWTAP